MYLNDKMAAGGAILSTDGKRLVVTSKKGQSAMEWNNGGGYLHVWDLN